MGMRQKEDVEHWIPERYRTYSVSTQLRREGRTWYRQRYQFVNSASAHIKTGHSPSIWWSPRRTTQVIGGKTHDYFPETVATLLQPLSAAQPRDICLLGLRQRWSPTRSSGRGCALCRWPVGARCFCIAARSQTLQWHRLLLVGSSDPRFPALPAAAVDQAHSLSGRGRCRKTWYSRLTNQILPSLDHFERNWLFTFLFIADDLRGWSASELNTTGAALPASYAVVAFAPHRYEAAILDQT